MELFLTLLLFWLGVFFGGKRLLTALRQRRYLTPAHSLKEIKSAAYYSRLTTAQFESLVMQGIRAREFTLLGNPWLGRTHDQGCAWKRGKKTVLTHHLRGAVTEGELNEIARRLRVANADRVLVFSPLGASSIGIGKRVGNGVELLSGKTLLRWFATLDTVAPPVSGTLPAAKCQCGAAMKERVSRAGLPMYVCSMSPDCQTVRRPEEAGAEKVVGREVSRLVAA